MKRNTTFQRPQKTELAYIAGIIDGEGWIGTQDPGRGHGRVRPVVEVSSIDADLIEWLHATAGGIVRPPRVASGNQRELHRWRITGRAARDLLRWIEPYIVMQRRRDKIADVTGTKLTAS